MSSQHLAPDIFAEQKSSKHKSEYLIQYKSKTDEK